MSVAQTSRDAYAKVKPELGARQQEVFDTLIGLGRASNQTLAYVLELREHVVTPRIKELREKGLVELAGTERSMYGNTVKVWKPAEDKPEQLSLVDSIQDCGDE